MESIALFLIAAALSFISMNLSEINKNLKNKISLNMNRKETDTAYIEINIKSDFITVNLIASKAKLLNVGDKLVIDKNRISEADFYANLIQDYHRKLFLFNRKKFFPDNTSECIIKITERLFRDCNLELHGEIISDEGMNAET